MVFSNIAIVDKLMIKIFFQIFYIDKTLLLKSINNIIINNFFFINKNLFGFFSFINIVIIIMNKNRICFIYINNKVLANIFIMYNIDKREKCLFVNIFYII